MKKILLALLKNTILSLQKLTGKLDRQNISPQVSYEEQHAYHSLSPLGNADPQGAYANALRWALINRKAEDIKNIAVTGSYGSGKSSILKTFQNHNKDLEIQFLNISLATFKEENHSSSQPNGSDLLRLIELSILQQIFYREEDEKIPDSRFKKIKSFDANKLKNLSIKLFLLLIASIQLYNKTFIEDIFAYRFYETTNIIITIICLLIVIPGYYFIIFKSIRAISSLTISKLNINNAEIEISDTISKSILNNHLDEILYFFEVTDYSVVIIEDLDRFEQTEIFTKLRELNLLINSSKKINRDITFIYAVRDDMFKDKDRTKFFDFIIPVIPVINSSNSNEKLMEIVKKNGYVVGSDLIENISLFIDDMRLLYNIANEYHVYHKKLGNLNQEKLMSMVVYKNIYPNDFVALSNSEGELYTVFNKKEVFLKEEIEEIDHQIKELMNEILQIESIQIQDVHELRMLYISEYVEKLPGITSFRINGQAYKFSKVTDENIFQAFVDDKATYDYLNNSHGNYYNQITGGQIYLKFEDVEKVVDVNNSYEERLKLVKNFSEGKSDELKIKIEELEAKKTQVRHYKIREIMALGGCKLELENKKQLQLVNILIRNGYIDEDYLDYISIFYEGSITKDDREFLLNVKGQIRSEFDYHLHKIDKLLMKINPVDFTQHYILNYDLIDFIFSKTQHKKQKTDLLKNVGDESQISREFLIGFFDTSKDAGTLVKELAKTWPRIWQFFSQDTAITKQKKALILKLILENASTEDIKAISLKSKLAADISSMPDFLNAEINIEKIKNAIKTLNVKFTNLNLDHAPKELVNFVYHGHYYMLNEEMLRKIIMFNGNFNETDFQTQNYYALNESGCEHLLVYIAENINDYVSDIYLKIDGNNQENEGSLNELLNNSKLSLELKEEIIDQVETKISQIDSVEEIEVTRLLFEASRIKATWANIIHYFHWAEDHFEEMLTSFINSGTNAAELSKVMLDYENPIPNKATFDKFVMALILNDLIKDTNYALVLKSIPYYYNNLDFLSLKVEKIKMLNEQKKIGLSVENFNRLKENHPVMIIQLLENWHSEFMDAIIEYEIGEQEVYSIIKSSVFDILEKNKVISHVDESLIIDSDQIVSELGILRIEHENLQISKNVLIRSLYSPKLSVNRTIKLLNKVINLLSKDEITNVLKILKTPYSEITILGKRPKLDGTPDNWELANKLVNVKYIKNISEEKGKIRISTFRQNN